MRNSFALIHNELNKIIKRGYTCVILGIMLIALVSFPLLSTLTSSFTQSLKNEFQGDELENLKSETNELKTSLAELKKDLADLKSKQNPTANTAQPGSNVAQNPALKAEMIKLLETDIQYRTIQIDWYQAVIKKDKNLSVNSIERLLIKDWILSQFNDSTPIPRFSKTQSDELLKAYKNGTYSDLLLAYSQQLSHVSQSTKEPTQNDWIELRQKSIETLIDRLKSDPDAQNIDIVSYVTNLEQFENISRSLEVGIIQESVMPYGNNTLITPAIQQRLTQFAEYYRLKLINDVQFTPKSAEFDTQFNKMTSSGIGFVGILMLIIAASFMSNEIATGSIKSLIISPMKRSKIYWSKFNAGLLIMSILTIFIYLFSLGLSTLFFGFQNHQTVIYSIFGPFITSNLVKHLIDVVGQFFILFCVYCFAYCLSCWTKNTAISVALAIIAQFSVGLAFILFSIFGRFVLGLLLPHPHMLVTMRLFPSPQVIQGLTYTLSEPYQLINFRPSAIFSAIYVVCMVTALLWIGRDAFVRKDIK